MFYLPQCETGDTGNPNAGCFSEQIKSGSSTFMFLFDRVD